MLASVRLKPGERVTLGQYPVKAHNTTLAAEALASATQLGRGAVDQEHVIYQHQSASETPIYGHLTKALGETTGTEFWGQRTVPALQSVKVGRGILVRCFPSIRTVYADGRRELRRLANPCKSPMSSRLCSTFSAYAPKCALGILSGSQSQTAFGVDLNSGPVSPDDFNCETRLATKATE